MKTSASYLNRFVIPKIGADAPISFKKVAADGQMPMPDSPDDIAYYDFPFFPGLGGKIGQEGNAIFSGHVDSGFDYCDYGKTPPPCQAVLWDLDKIKKKDSIEISFDGKRYIYKVIWNHKIKLEGKTWKKILISTKKEALTVFTCAGEFNSDDHKYNTRQVIRAIRIS